MGWDHPNPVFIDFETQSACDIKEEGGYAYVHHPSTRILITVVCIDSTFYVWIPDYISVDTSRWNVSNLWPFALKPKQEVRFYRGKETPDIITRASESIPFVAHNAFGFDRYIWERFNKSRPEWIDSLFVARLSGRPGRLDSLGKSLFGQGKDRASKLLPKLTTAHPSMFGGYSYPIIGSGDLEAFTRYAIGDVEIIRRAWSEFDNVQVEPDVIRVNNKINTRGIKVDVDLLNKIEQLSNYSTEQAYSDIADMTEGALTESNIRSTKQVHEWLEGYGVRITGDDTDNQGNKKLSLRKEHVQRFIDSPYLIDDYLVAVKEIPPMVIEVLKLRMKALRITGSKVLRMKQRACADDRIRDWIAYHLAHTGRFGSLGIQGHNFPRPHELLGFGYNNPYDKKDISFLEELLNRIKAYKSGDIVKLYNTLKYEITNHHKKLHVDDQRKHLTIDDICSAMMRLSFIPESGNIFGIVDYSQVEARCVPWMCNEEKLLDAFANNRDVYKEFATILYGVPLNAVTPWMRQVTKQVVLGCGYGMAAPKFRVYCANAGVDLVKANVTAEQCIDTFRDTYTRIAGWKPPNTNYRVGGLWKELDKAIMDCVSNNIETGAGKCSYHMERKDLICTLPSGRRIHYPDARVEDVIPPYCYTLGLPLNPKATVVFNSNRGVKSLYGGLATENNSQAICRDFMCDALVELDTRDFATVGHYHDEILSEFDSVKADTMLREKVRVMSTVPDWGCGFPLACEGFLSPRFTKKPFQGYHELATKGL